MGNTEYFYCYNAYLRKWLEEKKGIQPISRLSINPDNNKRFKMYLQTDELTRAINDYKESRKQWNNNTNEDDVNEKSKSIRNNR